MLSAGRANAVDFAGCQPTLDGGGFDLERACGLCRRQPTGFGQANRTDVRRVYAIGRRTWHGLHAPFVFVGDDLDASFQGVFS